MAALRESLLAPKRSVDRILVINERSVTRRGKLKRVLEAYDRILLDAPCFSERHVFHDSHALDA